MKFQDLPRGLPGTSAEIGSAPRALWMPPEIILQSEFWQYNPDKLFLGALHNHIVGVADNRHLVTIAGSRAGKGTSVIVPNLLQYSGSVLVIDPKGENASLTALRRSNGEGVEQGGLEQDVYVIDPFGVADVPSHLRAGFNPFTALDPDSPAFIDDCDSIADALVVAEPGKENDHWNSSARLILRGVIAWIAALPEIEQKDLVELRRLMFLPLESELVESLQELLAEMSVAPHIAHGIPSEAANALLGMEERERGSVLSTIRQNLSFLSSPPMGDALSGDFRSPDLSNWKFGKQSIYLCLPAGRLHRHFRFFRLFINRLLAAVETDKKVPDVPAVMILDEMHVLGHMAMLETAAGLLAGFGVRIWSIWQDMSQLKHLYRDRWETFLGNASILQFFGNNDLTTLKYISERLGKSSIMRISQGEISGQQVASGFTGESHSINETALLSPDEIAYFFSRQSGNQLILYSGSDPIFLRRLPFWENVFKPIRQQGD